MKNIYFQNQLNLLKQEQEADQLMWSKLQENSSINERKANGITWYPIIIKETELGRGDYLSIIVHRPTQQSIYSQFRFGASVSLFSNHNPTEDRIKGVVGFAREDTMKISFMVDELPEWAQDGKLGVDVLFDENVYKEMEQALINADALSEKSSLIQQLIGVANTQTLNAYIPFSPTNTLNESQQKAVTTILNIEDLQVVHGPPGTGKTTTLVAAIQAYHKQFQKQILVVAPSNAAVDLLSERLAATGLNVLRVGNPARVNEDLLPLLLDEKVANHPHFKQIKQLKKQAASYLSMAHKYKRNFGPEERIQRKLLFKEARTANNEAMDMEQYISKAVIEDAAVITATLVGANHQSIQHLRYDIVFIDEAAQALEPACWIPILKSEKIVFAGDHCQLPPTVKSKEASDLLHTLMEKVILLHPNNVTLLDTQYRMHAQIMQYPSQVFYKNLLKAADAVVARKLFTADHPIQFIDTAGCGYEELIAGTAIQNPEEAAFSLRYLNRYLHENKEMISSDISIAIIAPYKLQVETLKTGSEQYDWQQFTHTKIAINTIDGFQGQEKDLVLISLTRSNAEGVIGFLSDIRRMNVAMTRAKMKLIIIGDSATISRHEFYADFITYCEQQDAYHSAWEYME